MNTSRLGARPTNSRSTQSYKNALRSPVKNNGPSLRKHRPDYMLVVYMAFLLVVGAVTVYAISPGITTGKDLSENFFSIKQLTAIGLGTVAFIIASLVDTKTWKKLEIPLIILAVVVAIAVRFIGEEVNGAYRWLQVGGLSFQAAELIKFTLVIWLAGYFARLRVENRINSPEVLKVIGGVILAIGFVVAGLQSDLGSAAVMMTIIVFMAIIAGLPMKKLLIVGSIVLLLSTIAVVSSPYRIERVTTFLNPTADCQNEGYQACQALITVGSGGLFGKGLGRSVQAYGYLPEAANDSIFAIVSEKFGFIGSTIILGVFVGLFKRIKNVAEHAPNDYSRLLASGILAWLSVQMIINIGAMIGLLPLKGITLPFVSYGGTSIIFVMAAVGIVFHISRYTDLTRASKTPVRQYGDRKSNSSETTRFSSSRLR
jgi:cell division protein FtsW